MQCCTVIVPDTALEALMVVLARRVPFGWEEETRPTGETCVRVYCENPDFMETLAYDVCAIPDVYMHLEEVDAVDWTSAWREYFTPVLCGSRFVVLPPWLTNAPEAVDRTAIIIEPRSAFGTGHHATTALCLKALSDLVDEGCLCAGMTFLDVGTGSGVLGIACCLSGLSGMAVDVDPLALDNARENILLNGVDMPLRLGSIGATPHTPVNLVNPADLVNPVAPVDIILANILDQPLRDMAADMTAIVRTGGMLILSGILDIQADSVLTAYTAHGMTLTRRLCEDHWVALVLKKQ